MIILLSIIDAYWHILNSKACSRADILAFQTLIWDNNPYFSLADISTLKHALKMRLKASFFMLNKMIIILF